MADFSPRVADRIKDFGELLNDARFTELCGGPDLIRQVVRGAESAALQEIWNRASNYHAYQKSLLALLFFGLQTPKQDAERIMRPDLLSCLVELGLLQEQDNYFQAVDYCVFPVDGFHLIGPRLFNFNAPPTCKLYFGYDSLLLAQAVRQERDVNSAFEVGAGTGLVSLNCPAVRTVASDIDPRAVQVASANLIINQAQARCSVIEGDLLTGLPTEGVDLIFSNPPYVPAPADSPLPAYSWGGEDGLAFVRRMLDEASTIIEKGARCILILSAYGDERGNPLELLLTQFSNRFRIRLQYLHRTLMQQADYEALAQGASMAGSGEAVTPARLEEHYKKHGFLYKNDCILHVQAATRPGLNVSYCSDAFHDSFTR
jgi:methylase of polypeptide subunit release factors